jgi:hypothetical protein
MVKYMYILSLKGENRMRKTVIVNLYGAPGAGKSTGSAYIFGQLKMNNVSVELVREFVKDKIYEKSEGVFNDQVYILGKQHFRQTNVKGNVDVIITDCPLIVQAYYTDKYKFPYADELRQLVLKLYSLENNINYFVNRDKPYNPDGRFQTEADSDSISDNLKEYLDNLGIEYKEINGNITDYDSVVADIIKIVRGTNEENYSG